MTVQELQSDLALRSYLELAIDGHGNRAESKPTDLWLVQSQTFWTRIARSRITWGCCLWIGMWGVIVKPAAGQESEKVSEPQYTNALIDSTSPYLLQHAHNPVDWMPWSKEAFAKAKREGKPIFVSIGYSTCYWCHVMERESFENEQVAKILNQHYVAIKVDREERPDIDEQLMLATQLLTGRGGWPNSVWLTQDGRPWMAGTYFPKDNFINALEQLAKVWETQPENVEKQAQSLTSAVKRATKIPRSTANISNSSPADQILGELEQLFDAEFGGFGPAPKFPPHGALRLFIHAAEDGHQKAREMLAKTLDAMWCGGIHDHVGGGFHRYSTDETWLLPHFEKMLYDNAQLMRIYTEAYRVTGAARYQQAVDDIFQWIQREMTDEQGGFYSAVDSESEGGEEGKFYTWSLKELEEVLGQEDAAWLAKTYQATADGNFAEESTGLRTGSNILHLSIAEAQALNSDRNAKLLDKLLAARALRESPHLDDKVLTAWNGLMISALARAGKVFEDIRYTQAAERAARFVWSELRQQEDQLEQKTFGEGSFKPQLLRSWRKGTAALPAYLNDYAFFAEGLLELYRSTANPDWLHKSEQLVEQMQARFEDQQQGGFYFTSDAHETLLTRSKNLFGGGNLPVGNGVAAQVLFQLHEITGKQKYLDSFQSTLKAFQELMRRSPRQVEHLVLAKMQFTRGQQRAANAAGKNRKDDPGQNRSNHAAGDDILQITLAPHLLEIEQGGDAELKLVIEIAAGFRIYRPGSDSMPVQGVQLKLKPLSGIELSELRFPPGIVKQDSLLETNLTIYEQRLELPITLTASKDLQPGRKSVSLQLAYQACDDRRCLLPATIEIPLSLEIRSGEDPTARTSK